MILKRVGALLVLLALSAGLAVAQDTPDLTQELVQGDVTLYYPEDWSHFIDPNGAIILSNGNIEVIATGGEIGEEVVFVQVIVVGNNLVSFLERPEEITAEVIMRQLAPPDAELSIEIIEREETTDLAFLDQSSDDQDNIVYVALIDGETFALVIVNGNAGQVSPQNDTIRAIIDTITVDFLVEVAEETTERYDIYEQSISEEGFPMLGSTDAPISVVEVSSFDCPACGFFYSQILPLLLERVEVGEINFQYVSIYGTGSIPGGESAVRAAYCAGEQDAFWTYHSLLFSWQDFGQLAFNGTRLLNGAIALDLDDEAWLDCFYSEAADDAIILARDFADALGADFRGTPTILINGQRVDNSAIEVLALIDSILAESE